jgi:hypothetical protein
MIGREHHRWRALPESSLDTLSKRIHETTPCALHPVQQALRAAYGRSHTPSMLTPDEAAPPVSMDVARRVHFGAPGVGFGGHALHARQLMAKVSRSPTEGDTLDDFLFASAKRALQQHLVN